MFSKYYEAVAMQDQEASTILAALESEWFYRHGYPISFLSDQGRNVDGLLVREMCRKLGIRKLHSSPYHPQGDGEAERCIQSFKQTMRCLLARERLDRTAWPQILPQISLHTTLSREPNMILFGRKNSTSGFSPNQIMFGSRLRTKIDAAIPPVDNGGYFEMDTYYERAARDNSNIYERASANTEDAQRMMKRYYDGASMVSEINPGDLVLVKDECRPDSLSPIFKGPWRVVERRDGNVHISDLTSAKTRVIHINRCKRSETGNTGGTLQREASDTTAEASFQEPNSDSADEQAHGDINETVTESDR